MKIQLSPKKIISDAVVVWNQPGPEVDVTMDLKNLTFREGSVEEIYSFHVLDHLFEEEIMPAILNWKKCVGMGGKMFFIVDNFEFLARAFIGGDIGIDEMNSRFAHPTNITRDNLLRYLKSAGFPEDDCFMWFVSPSQDMKKEEHELIFSSKKHE